jgi:hypothetical protein
MSGADFSDHYFLYNYGALAMLVVACASLVFAIVTLYILLTRVIRESRASVRDEYNIFVFLTKSRDLFNEHYQQYSREKSSTSMSANQQ